MHESITTNKQTKVLIVDDDPVTLRLLSQWLASAGYVVQQAGDGHQAMAAIETDCPDILVTDWEMPKMDGLELCRWVRRQTRLPHYVYTLFLSIRTELEDIVKGLEAGADDFLKKPISHVELLARVKSGARVLDLESKLSKLAKNDGLTGLATQKTMIDQFEREWGRAKRYHLPLSCAMIDIDFFKRVNDTYGHSAGNAVLCQFADMLRVNTRGSDFVSRFGGEEFCILLPETDERNAHIWADRTRETIASTEIQIEDTTIHLTASFGVAQRLDDTESPEELVDLADQALLVAKQSGRDRVVSFQSINATSRLRSSAALGPGALFRGTVAGDVMTNIIASLKQDDLVSSAANFFLRFRISSAPVVDDDGKLVGILSEKDMLNIMLGTDWSSYQIKDVMKSNVVCYEEDTAVLTIYEFLCRVAIRSVVIVNDGRPTGVLSRGSLVRWFSNSTRAKHHDSRANSSSDENAPNVEPKERLLASAQDLLNQANIMSEKLQESEPDILPCVVSGASRIQELVNDMLACSGSVTPQIDEWASSDETQQGIDGLTGIEDVWFPPGCEPEILRTSGESEPCAVE